MLAITVNGKRYQVGPAGGHTPFVHGEKEENMKRLALVLGTLLLVAAPFPCYPAIPDGNPEFPPGRTNMKDKGQEDDCDCCQKCKAAKKTVKPKHEEGTQLQNGCEECCKRCGRPLPVAPEETPPDIIEKHVPQK